MQKVVSPWAMLAVICILCLSIAIAVQSIPPVLSLIIEDLNISHAEVGLFSAMATLPGIFLIIPLSMFSGRIGIKRIGLIAAALIITGSAIIFFSNNFVLLLAGRTIVGIGVSSLAIVGLQSTALWFGGDKISLAMGIYSMTLPLAGIICLLTFGAAGLAWGWRSILLITITITMVALTVYAAFFRVPLSTQPAGSRSGIISAGALGKLGWPIWVLSGSWGIFNLGLFSVSTFLPDFIYQSGFDLRVAGAISSIMMGVALPFNPVTGILLDKTKHKELYGILGSIICALCLFLLPLNVDYIVVSVLFLGIFTCPFAIATFAIAPQLVKRELMPLAYGMVATMAYVGMFLGPYLTGLILDATHEYTYGYWAAALFFLLTGAMMAALFFNSKKQGEASPG